MKNNIVVCMKRSAVLALTIFSYWLAPVVRAQSSANCLTMAGQAYQQANYTHALDLYERVMFFDREHLSHDDYESIARCYAAIQQFDKAAAFFQTSAIATPMDSLRAIRFLKVAWCQLMQRNYQEALLTLYNLSDETLSVPLQHEKQFYIGVACFCLNQFDESHNALSACFSSTNDKKWLDSLFMANHHLTKRYNPRTAKTLSMILPGSGQLYTGDIQQGLFSLLLVSGILALGVNYFLNYTWIDSLTSIAPWFQRYYFGGFQRAEQGALSKISKKRLKLLNQVLTH